MLEKIFRKASVLARHKTAPLLKERQSYLGYLADKGYAVGSLAVCARQLLNIAGELSDSSYPVAQEQIDVAAERWAARHDHRYKRSQRKRFVTVAEQWFRFLGQLQAPVVTARVFDNMIDEFGIWLDVERGLSARTIHGYCRHVTRFMEWHAGNVHPFSMPTIEDVDRHVITCSADGWSRTGLASRTTALKVFFRYAAIRCWCPKFIAEAIERPRIYDLEGLPAGPAWDDVQLLLNSMNTDHLCDIRDRAIVLLFAMYGLRAGEVAGLRLDDIDWDREQILVRRTKQRTANIYPLNAIVGNAILRYLKDGRRKSAHREIFLRLNAPFESLSRGALYNMVRDRLDELGIVSRRRGPHSLRHACAIRLVDEGLCLKEIGDHLGHRSSGSTRVYAKVNVRALREVADFDMGGAL